MLNVFIDISLPSSLSHSLFPYSIRVEVPTYICVHMGARYRCPVSPTITFHLFLRYWSLPEPQCLQFDLAGWLDHVFAPTELFINNAHKNTCLFLEILFIQFSLLMLIFFLELYKLYYKIFPRSKIILHYS